MSFLQHGLSEDSSYTINQSLRFRASGSAYLSRTPSVVGNRKTFSYSTWLKLGTLGAIKSLYEGCAATNYITSFQLNASGQLLFQISDVTHNTIWNTSALFRDPAAHYHIFIKVDTTQSTQANMVSIAVNGIVQSLTVTTYTTAIPQNFDSQINYTCPQYVGVYNGVINNLDGYLSEINFIDGQALDPSSFGQTDPATGIWVPKKYTGTYGTNGFYLPFNDATSLTTLGYDRSGNGNNWTCNNISLTAGATYDVMKDSPTNSGSVGNYATLNPLYPAHSTLTNGNLTASGATDLPTIIPDSGTWYFEIDGVSKTWTPPAAFPAAAGNYNFGQRPFTNTPTYPTLHTGNLPDATPVTTSGTFTGNASTDGPCIFINGTPTAMTINSNAVTFATHADKLAGGFKVRSSLAAYNVAGSNTYSITTNSGKFKYARAQGNP